MATLTPMMKQFYDLKSKHPDALLLFRCGDFYETYADDAVKAASVLGITLTRRNNQREEESVAMAGFPYHALDTYLPRLVRAGMRVAICDQLEDPKLTKKLVKRGITELVTPGLAMTETVLDNRQNNFLAAVHFAANDTVGLSLLDISTGEWLVAEGSAAYVAGLMANFGPKEVLYERGRKGLFEGCFGSKYTTFQLDDWVFTSQTATDKLHRHFGVRSLKGFGIDTMRAAVIASGAVLQYLEATQHTQLDHVSTIRRIEEQRYVHLDRFTIRNLELVESQGEGGTSLLAVLDRTTTPMGARLLRRFLLFPLCDKAEVEARHDVVDYCYRHAPLRDLIVERLRTIGDMERLASRAAVGRVTPRDLVQLRIALEAIVPVKAALSQTDDTQLQATAAALDPLPELAHTLARQLTADPPLLVAKGGVIATGVSAELDQLRQIAHSSKDYLQQLVQREAEATGILSLKVGYNNVFGYYLEVRNTYRDHVPAEWTRKQTLVGAERYITQELKEYEETIMGAEDKILTLEAELFGRLVQQVAAQVAALLRNAKLLAELDCLVGYAVAAVEHGYVRPAMEEGTGLSIVAGRHPVIEVQMPAGERYVANDVHVDTASEQILIITGPNMAGKSALLRQTALIVLMAQAGSFVPADSAKIGMVDKIFTRVGASDNISAGESTFMVEMTEAASILNNVTERSLVLFDELGRGTSTYDGISLAWAIVEYLHDGSQGHPRTLFATHYHELNEMAERFARIRAYNVSVREVRGKIIFLRKLEPGGTSHSFGLHVARLAGMPREVVARAEVILHQLEQSANRDGLGDGPNVKAIAKGDDHMQLNFFQLDDPVLQQIRDELLELDVNSLTPLQALNKLDAIKRILRH